jgi:hypothetical protein
MHGTGRWLKFGCCRKTGIRCQKSDSGVNFDEDKDESKRTPLGDRFPFV